MIHRTTFLLSFLCCFFLVSDLLIAQTVADYSPRTTTVVFDRWNPRFFHPSATIGVQVGLLPTFLKDQVHGKLPPLSVRAGYQFLPAFSLELEAGRSTSRTIAREYNTRTEQPCRNTFSLLALRPTGHVRLADRADAYGGLLIGYQHNQIELSQPLEKGEQEPRFYPRNGWIMTGFIGVDYAVTPRLRTNMELALGMSLISTGLRYRLY